MYQHIPILKTYMNCINKRLNVQKKFIDFIMYETETVTTYPDFHRSPPPHPFNQTKKTHISKPQNKSYTFYSFFNPPGTLLMVGGVFLVMWTCRI